MQILRLGVVSIASGLLAAGAIAAEPLQVPKNKRPKPVEKLDLALPEFAGDDPLGLPLLDFSEPSGPSPLEPLPQEPIPPATPGVPDPLAASTPFSAIAFLSESGLSVPFQDSDDLLRRVTPLPPEVPTPPPTGTFDLTRMAVDYGAAVLVVKSWNKHGAELGSSMGFFVSADGRFFTDGNLLSPERARELDYFTAIGADGTSYVVKGVLATDVGRNLLLLQANATDVAFLALAEEQVLKVPYPVVIAGRLGERDVSMSEVSLVGERKVGGRETWWSLQGRSDAAFPGSPVLDAKGTVLGVVTMYVPGQSWTNYAVPAPVARTMLANVKPDQKPVPVRRVLRKSDGGADDTFVDAYDAFTAGSFDRAAQITRRIVARSPQSGDAWGFLGLALARSGQKDEALGCFEKAVNLQPDNPALWAQLALLYRAKGNVGAELDALQRVLANNPGDSLGWLFLGEVRLRRGEMDEAASALGKATTLLPDSPHAFFLAAFVAAKRENLAGAEGAILQSLRLDRDSARSWYLLGLIYRHGGRAEKAAAAFQQTVDRQPDHPKAWLNLAHSLKVNDPAAAKKAFQRHLEILSVREKTTIGTKPKVLPAN